MRYLFTLCAILALSGCFDSRAPVKGPIAPPDAGKSTSAATEQLVGDAANAAATGDKGAAKGAAEGLKQQDRAELNGGLRWEVLTGVLIFAIGCGIAWYLGPKLGGGVMIVGGAVSIGALTIHALAPYWGWVTLGGAVIGLIAAAIHFRAYVSAVFHMAHGTEGLASGGVKTLIAKIRSRGPSLLTRAKALLHHAPLSVSQTVTTNLPTRAP